MIKNKMWFLKDRLIFKNNHLILIGFVLFCSSFLFTFKVLAAPGIVNINGSVENGQTVSISGSGFGTKSQATPEAWDNFEAGVPGQNISGKNPLVGPAWSAFGGSPVYTSAVTRPGTESSRSGLHVFNRNQQTSSLEFNGVHSQYYFTYWFRYDRVVNKWPRQFKPWYIDGNVNENPQFYSGYGSPQSMASCGGSDASYRTQINDSYNGVDYHGGTLYGGPGWDELVGRWVRMEVLVTESSLGVSNGSFHVWTHMPDGIRSTVSTNNVVTRSSPNHWDQLYIGFYVPNDDLVTPCCTSGCTYNYTVYDNDSNVYTDDVYIDNTPARIEIGNASTWDACTRREIQIPSSWSDNSIQATINQGSFANGSTVYLFIVDSNNVPSVGYPVVLGGNNSDIVAPSTPAGLATTTASSSQINLSWIASTDNVAVAGYRIYRNGSQIATTTNTSYSDSNLTPSTQYSYAVSAFDAARNFSAQCVAVNATTQSVETINKHDWPMEVLSWDIDKAYPGIEYNYRLAVRGGEYPYTFTLTTKPTGMTINERTGEIIWIPSGESQGNQVSVLIVDSNGSSLAHSFTVDSDRAAFRFVASNGSNANSGTENLPWATMAYASANAGNTRYVYVKAGTYQESMIININNCGRFLAYPGDVVTIVGGGSGNESISIRSGEKMIFQGFTFDANDHRWLFSVDSPYLENIIWRKNIMHNIYSNDSENPAFIFFWDGDARPIDGREEYKNIVIQENTFYDIENVNNHGASVTMYNVQDALFEDNIAYDIDGRGVSDKDDGYRNTFRGNVIHDCLAGIMLANQATQGSIEINYNLVYNCGTGVVLSSQPGYLKDVFVHHNTIIGDIAFSNIIDGPESTNLNIYNNVIGDGIKKVYSIEPRQVFDDGSSYHYEYPNWFQLSESKMMIDNNLIWGNVSSVAGYEWGLPATTFSSWQSHGFDVNSVLTNPNFDANYSLALNSPYYGVYGRDFSSAIQSDTNPPIGSVSINSGASHSKSSSAVLSIVASDISGVTQMKLSDVSTNFASLAALSFSSTYSWTLLGADGLKTVYAWFKDTLGNWNSEPVSDSITLDTLSSDINNVVVSSINTNSVTVTYTTSEAAMGYVEYGLSTSYISSTTADSSYLLSHSVNFIGLSASTTYHYQIIVTDRAGNQSSSIDRVFTTAVSQVADDVAPGRINNLSVSNIFYNSATLSWTSSGDDGSFGVASVYDVRYSDIDISSPNMWDNATAVSGEPVPNTSGTRQSIILAGLSASSRYYVAIKSIDEAGNISSTSNVVSFITLAAPSAPSSGGGGGGSSSGGGGASSGSINSGAISTVSAPLSFMAIGAKGQILLSWQNPLPIGGLQDFIKVKILRKKTSSPTSAVDGEAQVVYEGTAQQFIDTGLENAQTYYYALYSYDRNLNSSAARLANAKTDIAKETVSVPGNESLVQQNIDESSSAASFSQERKSLVGAKSAEVEEITKKEASELNTNPKLVPLDELSYKVYQKIIAISERELSKDEKYVIAHFIHYGTPTTIINGAGERGGSIASFKSAFGRLPKSESDWQDVIKIANGRWPTQRNTIIEKKAQNSTFAKVYGRAANMSNTNDNAAVTIISYGLRPAQRNKNSEKVGILAFKYYYKRAPSSAEDWDIVRAIAYSGARR
jgi:chitodextrinase